MPTKSSVALLLVLLAPSASAPREAPSQTAPAEVHRARVDAARTVCQMYVDDFRRGWLMVGEPVYRWSCRWLDAERDLSGRPEDRRAAARDHWNRMKDLERITKARFRRGSISAEEVSAVEYYRLEAEVWLWQAGGR